MNVDFANGLTAREIKVVTENYDLFGIPAVCSKNFGIHITVKQTSNLNGQNRTYSVTHLKTGCALSPSLTGLTIDEAVNSVEKLESLSIWNFDMQRFLGATEKTKKEMVNQITEILK